MIVSPTGSTLYVEVHGPKDAPPVILTHGWGMDSTIWYYLRREPVAPFPGHRLGPAGRVHISSVCVGVAERLIADCVAYASDRKQFGQPIANFQLVQALIADSKTEALAARALVLDPARKCDAGANVTLEAAATKLFASEMVGRVADRAVQVFGGAGYVPDYGIERRYRDVRIFRIYEGTSQIQQLIIARETLKRGG